MKTTRKASHKLCYKAEALHDSEILPAPTVCRSCTITIWFVNLDSENNILKSSDLQNSANSWPKGQN